MTLRFLLCATVALFASVARSQTADPGILDPEAWPRVFEVEGAEIALYMPQILAWEDFVRLKATMAIGVKLEAGKDAIFGAVGIEAATVADFDHSVVRLGRREFGTFRFPELDGAAAAKAERLVRSVLTPDAPMELPLASVTAAIDRADASIGETVVSFDPPPIFHAESEAILVTFVGEPRFESVESDDPSLLFAVNTNWDLLFDGSDYYLLDGTRWLATKDLFAGTWENPAAIPASFSKIPDDGNWSDVKASLHLLPEPPAPPKVFVSDRPAEIIVTDGKPQIAPLQGTSLMYVANTEGDLFYKPDSKTFYFLTAGRWFSASSLEGPWASASDSLPPDFAKLPEQHPKAHVLASVRGTPEADESVILASIPQTATVDRATTSLYVTYEGAPVFKSIPGAAGVEFAANTSFDVFQVGSEYYCCHQGVWFRARAALGPWAVCDAVPDSIYTIPPRSPKYNVTYVHVYSSDPQTVQVGATSGYSGSYIAGGLVVFGLGMWIGSELADDDWYWRYGPGPSWYGYGCGAVYRPGYGYIRAGARYYGPYGGAGYGAAYNPATGTYSRGAYAYGPRGAVGARTAYNPWTNTAAGRVGVSTPYGSWGRSAVVRDDEWVRAGHRSNPYGTVGGIQTSQGGAAAGINRKYGSDAFVGKTGDGDVYVGRDGNIYKKDSGGDWQKRQNGGWQSAPDVPRATPYASRGGVTAPQRPNQPTTRPEQAINRPAPPSTRPAQPINRPAPPSTRPAQPTTRPVPQQPSRSSYESRQSMSSQLNRDSFSRQRSAGGGGGGGGFSRRR